MLGRPTPTKPGATFVGVTNLGVIMESQYSSSIYGPHCSILGARSKPRAVDWSCRAQWVQWQGSEQERHPWTCDPVMITRRSFHTPNLTAGASWLKTQSQCRDRPPDR